MAAIEGVFLRDRSLRFAVLDESRLYAADLIRADLRNATLTEADISRARFGGADLSGADLRGADLSGADLSGAKLSDAVNLTQASLDRACGKPKALPDGLKSDKECPAK